MRHRIVIIGGGFAGLTTARGLGKTDAEVTIVDRHNYHLFQPLLYQVASAVVSPGDIAAPIRAILRRQKNTTVLFAHARAIDVGRRVVRLDAGEVPYDTLVLATGASHAYFGHDHWRDAAPGLKTLDDALEIRRRILLAFELAEREPDPAERERLLTFVVIGAGPTGVELAGAIAGIARQTLVSDFRHVNAAAARVLLVEGGPHVLPPFPDRLRRAARRTLERLGVQVRTDAMVTHVERGAVEIGRERIAAGTILWAAGVEASSLGRSLGVEVDKAGRVPVDEYLTVGGHPEIFVLGDLAVARGEDGKPLPGLAAVASQQGEHTARNIRRRLRGEPLRPFRYRDYGNMATLGRNAAVADLGRVQLEGRLAWFIWLLVHLLKLVGFRNRLMVLVQWFWSYVTWQRGVRLITGDQDIWDDPEILRFDAPATKKADS